MLVPLTCVICCKNSTQPQKVKKQTKNEQVGIRKEVIGNLGDDATYIEASFPSKFSSYQGQRVPSFLPFRSLLGSYKLVLLSSRVRVYVAARV